MLLRGVALFSDLLFHILSGAASVLGRGVGLGGLFRKGQRGQSSWSLGTKERVAGFLSGGGVFITPFHEPVVHSGIMPIAEG